MSVQQAEPPMTLIPKPERAQSQPESNKETGGSEGGGSVIWVRAGMHRGNTTP